MLNVDMAVLWSDETEQIVKGITEATEHIVSYYNAPKTTKSMFQELVADICSVCDFWTGKTYIGSPKDDVIKNAFQSFFEELMRILLVMKNSKKKYESKIANEMLFRGTVYRYLGNAYPANIIVKPQYDNIYVSWSKRSQNSYILSKLYGTVTFLSCEIKGPFYGIDLTAVNTSVGNEQEVVFPTLADCVREIKYLRLEEEDDNND